jgi:sulfonate transport system ATP-binding protein
VETSSSERHARPRACAHSAGAKSPGASWSRRKGQRLARYVVGRAAAKRVALARALVHDPNLLLLDEPLGSLDALTRIEMQQLIEDVWRSRGFTAMLVTHDVAEAISLADRVILIEGGRVALDEVVNIPRPRTRGSARFAALEERILGRVLQRRPVVEEKMVNDQW